ncbi:serine hydrolase domain-containing protein [Gallaecimonas sp. GXIMD4217]|uniref:serine hydrolase domain-containing protein n=1 Tax=Gallaecimonas sp. GXIMD4217 TaxID=3131927 RepID=UPI00311AD1DC
MLRLLLLLCLAWPALATPLDELFAEEGPRPFRGELLISRDGKALHHHSAGVEPGSRYLIGSLSKQLTAALVLMAVDQGKLNLDAPIGRYLPALSQDWQARVRVRHLLNHSSGILAQDRPLATAPGEAFRYSDLGYQLLGRILERVQGLSFAEQTKALFARCAMTGASPDGPVLPGFVEDEQHRLAVAAMDGRARQLASGTLAATVADLVAWNHCLHETDLLGKASYEAMTTASATRDHRWGKLGYGFGVQLGDGEISHSGYVPGYIATLLYYPATRTSVAILENVSWHWADMGRVFYFHDQVRTRLAALGSDDRQ